MMIPLLLIGSVFTDTDGSAIDRNLQDRLQVGEKLPRAALFFDSADSAGLIHTYP